MHKLHLKNIYGRYNSPYDIVLSTKPEDIDCLIGKSSSSLCNISSKQTRAMIFNNQYDITLNNTILGIDDNSTEHAFNKTLFVMIINNDKLFKKKQHQA